MADERTAESDPTAAFRVLANETRLGILEALASDPQASLSFSALRERVGTSDSGRFNYHLGKLVGRFVARTDDGYRLTTAGHQVYGAVLAGTYGGSVTFESAPLTEPCQHCGGRLELHYEDEHLGVNCLDCERFHVAFAVPAGSFGDRSPEELASVLDRRLRTTVELARGGSCPSCWGPIDGRLTHESVSEGNDEQPVLAFECPRCSERLVASPGALLLSEPAVIAAYHREGIDLRERPAWSLPWLRNSAVEILENDPLQVRVEVAVGDWTLAATIDADATVSAIEEG